MTELDVWREYFPTDEWYIVRDIFDFENMAFSKNADTLPMGGRLLCCPCCDNELPLGVGMDGKSPIYALCKERIKIIY